MLNATGSRIGIISFPAFFRGLGYGGWSNSAEVSSLKVLTLLYDRILVAAPREQVIHACCHFADEYRLQTKYLHELWGSIEEVQENILYSDSFREKCETALGLNLRNTYEQWGKYWHNGLFHTGQFHILSMVALPLWNVASTILPGIAAIETSDLPRECRNPKFQNTLNPKRARTIWKEIRSVGVPDPGSLTWKSIIELSKSKNRKNFYSQILQLGGEDLKDKIVESLWDDFKETHQDIKLMAAKSIISSMPMPIPINPISVVFSIQNIIETRNRQKNNAWLSFLFEVRGYKNDPPSTEAWGWAGKLNPDFTPPPLLGIDK